LYAPFFKTKYTYLIEINTYEIICFQMITTLKNSSKRIVLKQNLFIGNWDKTIATNGKQFIDILKNNDSTYGKSYLMVRI